MPLPLRGVLRIRFRLQHIEAMFSNINWLIAVFVVVPELEKCILSVASKSELSGKKCFLKAAGLPHVWLLLHLSTIK